MTPSTVFLRVLEIFFRFFGATRRGGNLGPGSRAGSTRSGRSSAPSEPNRGQNERLCSRNSLFGDLWLQEGGEGVAAMPYFFDLRLQDQGEGVAAIPFFAICGYRNGTKV